MNENTEPVNVKLVEEIHIFTVALKFVRPIQKERLQ